MKKRVVYLWSTLAAALLLNLSVEFPGFAQAAYVNPEAYKLTTDAANLIRMGNSAAALEKLKVAVSISPENWDVNYNCGLALEQLGRYEEAQQWYSKAYSIDDPRRYLGLLGVGRIFYEEKKYAEALPILAQLAGSYGASESTYTTYLTLAECYAETGNISEFCNVMAKALAFKANDPQAWKFAAHEMDHLQQFDLAIKYYGEYLKRFPKASDAPEMIKRLDYLSFEKEHVEELKVVNSGFSLKSDTDDIANFITFLDPKHTDVSDTAVAQVMFGLSQIPRTYRHQLENAGYKVVVAPTVLDALPQLTGVAPRGYNDGASWHATNGAFDRNSKKIVVGEKCNAAAYGGQLVEGPLDETAQHECGHAYDAFMGSQLAAQLTGDPNPDFSHTKNFSDAYDKDVAAVPADLKQKLAYYLQPGNAGKEELFAQLFVLFFGHQPEPGSPRESFQTAFPNVLKLFEDSRKADPDFERLQALYDERLRENTLTPQQRAKELLR